jgi:hypothetical protein
VTHIRSGATASTFVVGAAGGFDDEQAARAIRSVAFMG